ncbi:AEC family transporter [Candidatus Omnitrophota bacterium]
MVEEFYSFPVVLAGMLKILFLMGIGFFLSAAKVVKKGILDVLSVLLVWVCLPALFFVKITSFFEPAAFPSWWILPIVAIVMCFLGLGFGFFSQKLFKDFSSRREFMASCAFQNCGYLPMCLVVFITTGALREELLIYIFLFLVGFNVSLWVFVPTFLANKREASMKFTDLFNPPMIFMITAFVSVAFLGKGWVPKIIAEPLSMVGNASFPLSLLLVGISLEIHKGYRLDKWSALVACIIIKLFLFPLGIMAALSFLPFNESDAFIIFLESIMPVAVTLVLIGHYKGADNAFLSGSIFYSHIVALLTIPLWLFLYSTFF